MEKWYNAKKGNPLSKPFVCYPFFSFLTTVIGMMLVIFHIGSHGKDIIKFSVGDFVIGLVVLTISVVIPIFRIRKIVSAEYFQITLVVNLSLCLFMTCAMVAILLRLLHRPERTIFVHFSQAFFAIFFLVLMYFIGVAKKKYPLNTGAGRNMFPDEHNDYVGSYRNQQLKIDINITKKDDASSLLIQLSRKGGFPLTFVERNTFTFAQAGIMIVFESDKQAFILFQGGHEFIFTKESQQYGTVN